MIRKNMQNKRGNLGSGFRDNLKLSRPKRSARVSMPLFRSKNLSASKRSQVTIFIIIAIIIVAGVLVYYLWLKPSYVAPTGEKLNIEKCMSDAIDEKIELLGNQGGFLEPEFFYLYKNDKIGYLCYTNLIYKPCVVQKPFLKQHFEDELERAVREKINKCYENSVNELKARGYDVVSGLPDLDILLEPGKVRVILDVPVFVSREGAQSFNRFESEIISPIYDILMIATSILQSETKYGDADVTGMMMFYPELDIGKIKRSDGTTVYIIEDLKSKTKFQFASRSFAYPAGYGMDTGLVSGK